jgi:hypothetical protein
MQGDARNFLSNHEVHLRLHRDFGFFLPVMPCMHVALLGLWCWRCSVSLAEVATLDQPFPNLTRCVTGLADPGCLFINNDLQNDGQEIASNTMVNQNPAGSNR